MYKISLLRKIKQHIKRGGIIAYPTESCYGLGCNPYNYKAINKLIKLKLRDRTKGLIVIANKITQLTKLIKPLEKQDLLNIQQYWPGHVSIILAVKSNILHNLTGQHQGLAIRIPLPSPATILCKFLNLPLVSTSANKSRKYATKNARDSKRIFHNKIMVLSGMIGAAKHPSKIINFHTMQIIRNNN